MKKLQMDSAEKDLSKYIVQNSQQKTIGTKLHLFLGTT